MALKQREWDGVEWINVAGGYTELAGCCEHSREPLGSIKCKEFFDYLSNSQLLKKHSAPYSEQVILVSPASTAGTNKNCLQDYLSNSLQNMKHTVLRDVMPSIVQSRSVVAHP